MRIILYIGILFSAASCGPTAPELRTGDLLFAVGGRSEMAGAITAATGREEALNYTHVAIVAGREADSVLEATSPEGVRMQSLEAFLNDAERIGGRPAVVAMRLRDTAGVAEAVERACRCMGLPYDYSFLPNNGKYYCSELVYENYLQPDGAPRFTARPMNFRAPDGTLPRFWKELFERMGEPIPEGIAGTNPNDMAKEGMLRQIHRYF